MSQTQIKFRRRTDTEPNQVGSFDDGIKRYYDQNMEMTIVKLFPGDMHYTFEDREMLVTIVGHYVCVCINNESLKSGGMCHVVVSEDNSNSLASLKKLLNELESENSNKNSLTAKIFGGSKNSINLSEAGEKTVQIVRDYLKEKNINIQEEDIAGGNPRRIHYFPDSGKHIIRHLRRKEDYLIFDKELEHQKTL